jgi:Putative Zn-dependent protease, contains TPR repeats
VTFSRHGSYAYFRAAAVLMAAAAVSITAGGGAAALAQTPRAGQGASSSSSTGTPAKRPSAAALPAAAPPALPAAARDRFAEGDRAMRNGDFDDAASAYARAALEAPNSAVLRMVTGVALSAVRRTDSASEQFRRAVQLADDDPIAALLLQGVLAEQGRAEMAQNVWLDAVRRFARRDGNGWDVSTSLARLRGSLTLFPESPILHLLLGDAYQMGAQWKQAEGAYQRAITLAPGWAKPRANLGILCLEQGNADQAVAIFQAALEQDPRNAQVLLFKGDAERKAGRVQDAIKTYQMIQDAPGVAVQATTRLGQAYAADGKVDAAIESFNRAQKMAPNDPEPSAALAEVQSRAGNFAAAAEAYGHALRLTRTGGLFGPQAVLYRALAETQIAAGKPDAALDTLKRALADEESSAPLWHRLAGQAQLARGDRTRAVREFKVALDLDTSLYPIDTLSAIDAGGLMDVVTRSYRAEAEGNVGFRPLPGRDGGGGIYLPVPTAPPLKDSGLLEGRARARSALAYLARYRNDVAEEVRQREALTTLRSRARDWYLLAETLEQRANQPARARAAYKKALDLGGLPDSLTERARERYRALTPPSSSPQQRKP